MFIVGVTGGIATGKSTVLSIFRDNGITVFDADDVARKVVLPGTLGWRQIKDYFGDVVLNPDDSLNRKVLGELIFNNIEKRRKLNEITHPKIQAEIVRLSLKEFFNGKEFIVIELPLLFETRKMIHFLHTIITVDCPEDVQLERLKSRNDISEEVAIQRIKTQMPIEAKIEKSNFAIDNSADLAYTRLQTERIIKVLKSSNFTWYLRLAIFMGLLAIFIGIYNVVVYFKERK